MRLDRYLPLCVVRDENRKIIQLCARLWSRDYNQNNGNFTVAQKGQTQIKKKTQIKKRKHNIKKRKHILKQPVQEQLGRQHIQRTIVYERDAKQGIDCWTRFSSKFLILFCEVFVLVDYDNQSLMDISVIGFFSRNLSFSYIFQRRGYSKCLFPVVTSMANLSIK